ncbi:MAG: thioesterase family protein [Ruminococcus sp.]|nr:thioesterase family protein [Ruminococcus sp.]MBQ7132915.1 thioesterase family protein [Ruminococcus sp.]
MLETGIKNTLTIKVTDDKTAKVMGSGTLDVFATPSMVALMEQTAAESVQPHLEDGVTSVGTKINVEHLSADPVGIEVTCESTLTEVDNRRLCFEIVATDKHGIVGKAYHERFLIKAESFMQKTNAKL